MIGSVTGIEVWSVLEGAVVYGKGTESKIRISFVQEQERIVFL
jgi:hypothetical protein